MSRTISSKNCLRFNHQNSDVQWTTCLLYLTRVSGFKETNPILPLYTVNESYVYWIVHHLDSWIKIDRLDVTCFIISPFTAQHFSNVSTSIFRSLRHIVDLFHVLCCSGSMCVGAGWSTSASACKRIPHDPAEPHRNTNTHRTRAIQHMK
jgi:hypothetical protein